MREYYLSKFTNVSYLIWFVASVIIVAVVIPTIFSNIDDLFKGGQLAIALFAKFNPIELGLGLFGFLCTTFLLVKQKSYQNYACLIIATILLGIALYCTFYLSPKIHEYTQLIIDEMASKAISIDDPASIQQELHHRYVFIDGVKLVLLLLMLTLGFFREKSTLGSQK